MEKVTMSVKFEIDYEINDSTSEAELAERIMQVIHRGMEEGMFTGALDVEIEDYRMIIENADGVGEA